MQKYKYALDLEENIYFLNSDFDTYKLSSDEIKKLCSEPISDKDSKYIDSKIVYNHTYIYLTPGEFIEQYKLHNNQQIELYDDIGKIKIKNITSENIKDISFILHHILTIRAQEEADVQGYEMPINNYWQCIPFNQRMNFGIENVLNRQSNIVTTQSKLDKERTIKTNDITQFSNDINFLHEEKDLQSFSDGLLGWGLGSSTNNQRQNPILNLPPLELKDPSLLNFSDNGNPANALNEVYQHLRSVKNAANQSHIEPALLFGILVAERMRYSLIQDGGPDYISKNIVKNAYKENSKGFAQITEAAALQGEIYYRNHNENPNDNIDMRDEKAIEKLKKEIKSNIFHDDKNIDYAAKYTSYLMSQFPLKNLTKEDRDKLVAAAYKSGPEAVKNARMQEQLNELLTGLHLAKDGDPGKSTNKAIYDCIISYKNDLISLCNNPNFKDFTINDIESFTSKKAKNGKLDFQNIYTSQEYPKIREMINKIWELHHPDEYNPSGAVPIYVNNERKKPEERIDLDIQDVTEAMKIYYNLH